MLRHSKSAIAGALVFMLALSFPGCRNAAKVPANTVKSRSFTLAIPAQWEQKPGTFAFRLRRNSTLVRFLVIDEVPATDGQVDATAQQLRNAFPSADRIVDAEKNDTWQGHRAMALSWHGTTKNGTPVQGEQRYVLLKNAVVSILWYAPTSEGDEARRDIANILDGMRFE